MQRPPLEVADIVRAAGKKFVENSREWITAQHRKVLRAIARCRTAALGYHVDECTHCGYSGYSYNSCFMVSNPLWRVRDSRAQFCRRFNVFWVASAPHNL